MAIRRGLNARDYQILKTLLTYEIERPNRPPTRREIMGGTDITSLSVLSYHTDALVIEGYITIEPEISCGVKLTDRGRVAAGGWAAHPAALLTFEEANELIPYDDWPMREHVDMIRLIQGALVFEYKNLRASAQNSI